MTIFEARPHRLREDTWRFTCGRRGIDGWCSGNLGAATYLPEVRYPDGSTRSVWVLGHPHGLYQDGDDYRVVAPAVDPATGQQVGRKDGRRPRPSRIAVLSGTQQVLGQQPVLPLTIHCPTCDRVNRADIP